MTTNAVSIAGVFGGGWTILDARGWVLSGLLLVCTAGCSKLPPDYMTEALAVSPQIRSTPPQPLFDAELVHNEVWGNGRTGGGIVKCTVDHDGHAFYNVDNFTVTVRGDGVTIKYTIDYLVEREGKDIYRLSYFIQEALDFEADMVELAYDGESMVTVEHKYGSVVLQPPSG